MASITRIGFWGDAGESLSTKSETKDDICILKECVYTYVQKTAFYQAGRGLRILDRVLGFMYPKP